MNQNMPSQKEQDMVAWYVLERPLVRPDTSYQKAARCIALFLLANCGMTFALYTEIKWLGIFVFSSKGRAPNAFHFPCVPHEPILKAPP